MRRRQIIAVWSRIFVVTILLLPLIGTFSSSTMAAVDASNPDYASLAALITARLTLTRRTVDAVSALAVALSDRDLRCPGVVVTVPGPVQTASISGTVASITTPMPTETALTPAPTTPLSATSMPVTGTVGTPGALLPIMPTPVTSTMALSATSKVIPPSAVVPFSGTATVVPSVALPVTATIMVSAASRVSPSPASVPTSTPSVVTFSSCEGVASP